MLPLAIPDPDQLSTDVAAALAPVADAADLGIELAARMLRNPYEPVLWILEVLGQAHRTRLAQELGLVLEICGAMVNHQAELLASTTSGNAVLRRLWFALEPVDATMLGADQQAAVLRSRRLLALALGLVATVPPPVADTWQGPLHAGSSVQPREPALPAAARGLATNLAPAGSLAAVESSTAEQVIVLGRQLSAGRRGHYGGYTGPAHVGRVLPAAFVPAHRAEINPVGDPRIDARADVVVAISPNEGLLDAARLRDRGILSTGLQQWTKHVNTEATVLWDHFRGLAPDHFDLHFGLYRMLTQIWGHTETAATSVPSAATLAADNPWADSAVVADPLALPAAPDDHFPTYATLYRLDPGAKVRMQQPSGASIGPRFGYFGGHGPAGLGCSTTSGPPGSGWPPSCPPPTGSPRCRSRARGSTGCSGTPGPSACRAPLRRWEVARRRNSGSTRCSPPSTGPRWCWTSTSTLRVTSGPTCGPPSPPRRGRRSTPRATFGMRGSWRWPPATR